MNRLKKLFIAYMLFPPGRMFHQLHGWTQPSILAIGNTRIRGLPVNLCQSVSICGSEPRPADKSAANINSRFQTTGWTSTQELGVRRF